MSFITKELQQVDHLQKPGGVTPPKQEMHRPQTAHLYQLKNVNPQIEKAKQGKLLKVPGC